MNGGNSSGNGIGCVSWDGEVYADQFWREHSLGNIRKRPFSQIWSDKTDPFIKNLKIKRDMSKEDAQIASGWMFVRVTSGQEENLSVETYGEKTRPVILLMRR